MKLPDFVDERFLRHRLRSTSHAGIAAASLALLLVLYRYLHDGTLDLDLLAIGAVFVILKYVLLFWYHRTD